MIVAPVDRANGSNNSSVALRNVRCRLPGGGHTTQLITNRIGRSTTDGGGGVSRLLLANYPHLNRSSVHHRTPRFDFWTDEPSRCSTVVSLSRFSVCGS